MQRNEMWRVFVLQLLLIGGIEQEASMGAKTDFEPCDHDWFPDTKMQKSLRTRRNDLRGENSNGDSLNLASDKRHV
ncbi:hypothetical protein [Mesorhizobium sp. M1322]|uniref:hypothetical protein n=1 Tax=Mesorhizobium sp. M1322 TaxID=2957081 RepID=UPI003337F610